MLKFLLILLIIFFLLRMMGRVVVIKTFKDMRDRMPQNPVRPEGHVTIEGNKGGPGKGSASQGEYVDYEEVK
jgi:hypothetical protein